jgi:hypothetical protein
MAVLRQRLRRRRNSDGGPLFTPPVRRRRTASIGGHPCPRIIGGSPRVHHEKRVNNPVGRAADEHEESGQERFHHRASSLPASRGGRP